MKPDGYETDPGRVNVAVASVEGPPRVIVFECVETMVGGQTNDV